MIDKNIGRPLTIALLVCLMLALFPILSLAVDSGSNKNIATFSVDYKLTVNQNKETFTAHLDMKEGDTYVAAPGITLSIYYRIYDVASEVLGSSIVSIGPIKKTMDEKGDATFKMLDFKAAYRDGNIENTIENFAKLNIFA